MANLSGNSFFGSIGSSALGQAMGGYQQQMEYERYKAQMMYGHAALDSLRGVWADEERSAPKPKKASRAIDALQAEIDDWLRDVVPSR